MGRRAAWGWRLLRDVGLPLLLTRLALLLVTQTAQHWPQSVRALILPDSVGFHSQAPRVGNLELSGWYEWDAAWYLRIAANGPQMGYSHYVTSDVHHFSAFAFFPLYPLTVRAAATLTPGALDPIPAAPNGGAPRPSLLVVALVVSNVIFALALAALYLLALARAGPAARRAVWLLCLFPTSVFFSAPYSEGMFLLWLVLFFLMLQRQRWWLAGLCGALAAATRSLGVALVLPYLAAYAQQVIFAPHPLPLSPRGQGERDVASPSLASGDAVSPSPASGRGGLDRRPQRGPHGVGSGQLAMGWGMRAVRALLPAALIPCGMLAYMAYLGLAWHDPLLWRKAEDAWSRSFQLPWVGIVEGIRWSLWHWSHFHELSQPNWRGLTDALYALVFLALTALAWRDFDWSERAYAVVFWIYVLCTPNVKTLPDYNDTLISMGRFLLVLVPLWLWLGRSRWRTLPVALPSALFFLVYAGRWVLGGWIG